MFIRISLFLLYSVLVNTQENPQVEISDGKIKGTIAKTIHGRKFNAFQGIPFAEPPVGPLRFKAPVPNKPWKDVLDATEPHTVCPQKQVFSKKPQIEGNEDCLYLNVYTPKLPSENSKVLPVMVWIHGGAFFIGSGNSLHYSPELLLDQDIVMVAGNYRLGALGFLSTGDEASPGNYGLKDQALLLKWVNKNVKYFGGDPQNVTLFGESAGGASTNYHIFSPLSKGLFKAVISQSGSALNPWANTPKGRNTQNAKKLAKSVDCPTSPNTALVECLRNVDPILLLDQDKIFMEWSSDPITPFRPVVEPPSPEAFILDSPYNLLKAGKFSDVPWLVGVTTEEGLLKTATFIDHSNLLDELSEDFNKKAAISLLYQPTAENIDSIGEKLRKFYFGDKKKISLEDLTELTNMYSDAWVVHSIDKAVQLYKKASKNSVYTYVFSHKGPISSTMHLTSSQKFYGTCHGDDLLYQFPNFMGNRTKTEDEKKISELFVTLWTNFARTNNPTPKTDDFIKNKWKPVKSDKMEHFYMDAKVQEMRDVEWEDRKKLWSSLPLESKNLQEKGVY